MSGEPSTEIGLVGGAVFTVRQSIQDVHDRISEISRLSGRGDWATASFEQHDGTRLDVAVAAVAYFRERA